MVTDIARSGSRNALSDSIDAPQPDTAGLDRLVAEINSSGSFADSLLGDVTSREDAEMLVSKTCDLMGQVDILVNNAAAPHGREYGDIDVIPPEEWDRVLAVAGRGTFLMCHFAVPCMRERGWGRIINISSVLGKVASKNHTIYSASKAAVLGLTRSLSVETAPHGITVNAICPGPIDTIRLRTNFQRRGVADVDLALEEWGKLMPVRRLGRPEDIGAAATFLATDGASFITGQDLSVDGGNKPQ